MMPIENLANEAAHNQHGLHEAPNAIEQRIREGIEGPAVLIPGPTQTVDHAAIAKSQSQYIAAQHMFITGDLNLDTFVKAQEEHASMLSGVIQTMEPRAYSRLMGDLIMLQAAALQRMGVV